jgi:hypothetical protein
MGVGQRHAPSALPQERPGTHCIGGWVGPRAGLDTCGKSVPAPGFNPRTVQPVASRYTDRAIAARSATAPFGTQLQRQAHFLQQQNISVAEQCKLPDWNSTKCGDV